MRDRLHPAACASRSRSDRRSSRTAWFLVGVMVASVTVLLPRVPSNAHTWEASAFFTGGSYVNQKSPIPGSTTVGDPGLKLTSVSTIAWDFVVTPCESGAGPAADHHVDVRWMDEDGTDASPWRIIMNATTWRAVVNNGCLETQKHRTEGGRIQEEANNGNTVVEWRLRNVSSGTIVARAKSSTVGEPLEAPSALSEVEVRSSWAEMTWTDNSNRESGFAIQRSRGGGSWSTVASVAADTDSYRDLGLRPATSYSYRVKATGAAGDSDWSNTLDVTTTGVPDGQLTGGCGSGDAIAPCATGGDPVNTATGAYTSSVTDLALPGIGLPFALTRSYDSGSSAAGALGTGWRHPFEQHLDIEGDGDVVLTGPNGQEVFYKKRSDGSFLADAGGLLALAAVPGGYEVTTVGAVVRSFDASGLLTSVAERNGNTLSFAYSGGVLDQITDTAGRVIDLTHNASGLLTKVELPDARSVSYSYTSGLLASVTDVRGGTTSYDYDSEDRLTEVRDQNGHTVVTNTYGTDGRVSEQTDARGKLWGFNHDPAAGTTTVTDPRGNEWTDTYEGNVLTSRTDPLGNTTTYGYDDDLNLTEVTDPRGKTTEMGYDGRGNMTSRTAPAPLSYVESWAYNARNDVTSHTNARGKTTTYDYDSDGNLIRITRPGSNVTELTRDPTTGLVASITDPRSETTTFTYDASGNLTEVTTPLGHTSGFDHDPSGRVTEIIEARGNEPGAAPADYTWTLAYDAANHLTSRTDPLGGVESWSYDPAGNLQGYTDQNSKITSYDYNLGNMLTKVTAPDATTTTYTYDAAGNMASRTDANSHTTTYAYDDADRLVTTTSPGGNVYSYDYDAAGNLVQVTDANGNATPAPGEGITDLTYDAISRLTGIDYSGTTPDVAFTYDPVGNLTQMSDGAGTEAYAYDNLDRLTDVARGGSSFAYAYDATGNLTTRTYPDATTTSYAYDADSRMTSATQGSRTTTYAYDAAGRPVTTTLPASNGHVTTATYDRAGRPTAVSNRRGPLTTSSFTYSLDAAGNPSSVTTTSGTTTYTYDDLYRLTSVCDPGCGGLLGGPPTTYAYDDVGNRTAMTTPSGTTTYTHDADDRLLSSTGPGGTVAYAHDANGNMTAAGATAYAYDAADRMVSATAPGVSSTYAYDGAGRRLSATTGTDVTGFTWDINHPLPELAAEHDGAGALLRRYTYGVAGAISMRANGAEHYLHRDRLGSVTDVTGTGGTREWAFSYGGFGESSATKLHPLAPEVPARYTGQYLDATGLYHLRARQYDAGLGRFLGPEPLPHPVSDPYVSAYAYVMNRPGIWADPSGLEAQVAGMLPPPNLVASLDGFLFAPGNEVDPASFECIVFGLGSAVGGLGGLAGVVKGINPWINAGSFVVGTISTVGFIQSGCGGSGAQGVPSAGDGSILA